MKVRTRTHYLKEINVIMKEGYSVNKVITKKASYCSHKLENNNLKDQHLD